MTPDELLSIVRQSGYAARVRRAEVQVEVCWFCGNDRWNLELAAGKGVFSCWNCRASGRLDMLLSDQFGIRITIPVDAGALASRRQWTSPAPLPTVPVTEDPAAMEYLRTHHVGFVAAIRYRLGVVSGPATMHNRPVEGRILVPLDGYWPDDPPAGYLTRAVREGDTPKYLADVRPEAVVGYRQRRPGAPHVLVEGIFDAMAVHAVGCNAAAVLGTRMRGEAFDRWLARVPQGAPVGILLDGAAQDVAQRYWWRGRSIRGDLVNLKLPPRLDPAALPPAALRAFLSKYGMRTGDDVPGGREGKTGRTHEPVKGETVT